MQKRYYEVLDEITFKIGEYWELKNERL